MVVFQVVKALIGEGVVYTVAPVDDVHQVKNVHWEMMKPIIKSEASAPSLATPSPPVTHLPLAHPHHQPRQCSKMIPSVVGVSLGPQVLFVNSCNSTTGTVLHRHCVLLDGLSRSQANTGTGKPHKTRPNVSV